MTRKRSLAPLVLAALVAAAVCVVLWFALSDEAPRTEAALDRLPNASTTLAEDSTGSRPAVLEERSTDSAARESARDDDARAEVGDRTRLELADAIWIEGRVVFPPATPLDERVEVIADGKDIPGVGDHRAKVDMQGRFRVAFSKESKTGKLSLQARYLHLDKPRTIKLSSPPRELLLEPVLGGAIAGRIVPPKGVGSDDVAAVTSKVKVSARSWTTEGLPLSSNSAVDKELRYELGGLAPAQEYSLEFEPKEWSSFSKDELKITPGEVLLLDIECRQGARIEGRVVDLAGASLGSASLEPRLLSNLNEFRWGGADDVTADKSGAFRLTGVPPGEYELVVSLRGYLDRKVPIGKLEDGDARQGLEIALDPGHFVSGVVKWPDGQPAAGAFVRAEIATPEAAANFEFDMELGTAQRVGLDGKFRISGLESGPLNVYATAKDGLRPDLAGNDPNAKRSALKGARWRAHAPSVAQDSELELVLQPGISIAGRVVDDRAQPITKFWVSALEVRDDRKGMPLGFEDAVSTKFEAEDGAFVLEGLKPGRWKIGARARGHATASAPDTELPGSGDLLVITLPRTTMLSGLVVDPSGAPAPKAQVRIDWTPSDLFSFADLNQSTTADAKGAFKLQNAPAGVLKVFASHAQFAQSQPLEVTVTPGQKLDGLRLVLTSGGRVRGRIHEGLLADGRSWHVSAFGASSSTHENTRASERGEFEFERLTAGEYQLTARGRNAKSDDESAADGIAKRNELSATVTVSDGSTTEVLLGQPVGANIVVNGRVTRAGQPLGHAGVAVSRDEFGVETKSKADGSFALVVEGAGSYRFTITSPGGGAFMSEVVEIAASGTPSVAFDFPGGRIAGRVLDTRRKPVSDARVNVQRVGDAESATQGGVSALETDHEGRFTFEGLSAGGYRLIVEDDQNWFRSSARFGHTVLTGLELEDGAALEGVEVVVEPAASLTCIVRGLDGQPAPGVDVHARRADFADGDLVGVRQRTDGAGRARLSGFSSGDHHVTARRNDEIGVSRAPVRIRSGAEETIELELRRGAYVTLSVQNSEGQPITAAMSVVDSDGVDWARAGSDWEVGESDMRWTLGPLPPGAYDVSAQVDDQGSASASVRLSSGERESVQLRLKKD